MSSQVAPPLLRPEWVQRIVVGSVENLLATWNAEVGLFPYSSQLVAGRIVNDYEHPLAVRYTLNSLLGLVHAGRFGEGPELGDVRNRLSSFLSTHGRRVSTLADAGMLLLLVSELDDEQGVGEAIDRIRASDVSSPRLSMQDLAWALWGSVAAIGVGVRRADTLASSLRARIIDLTSPLGLPLHSTRRYRRRVVSFGAIAYFLRALHEAALGLQDEQADRMFRAGVERVLAVQGPLGDWPWMIDPVTGRVLDRYPVFAVHQDSMAMLFLLPAFDRGLPDVEEAIDRSLEWALGRNELGIPMYVDEPVFFAYRSIERRERVPRVRRYLRSSLNALARRSAETLEASALRLNPECRSYHLGWVLHAWCARIAGVAPR